MRRARLGGIRQLTPHRMKALRTRTRGTAWARVGAWATHEEGFAGLLEVAGRTLLAAAGPSKRRGGAETATRQGEPGAVRCALCVHCGPTPSTESDFADSDGRVGPRSAIYSSQVSTLFARLLKVSRAAPAPASRCRAHAGHLHSSVARTQNDKFHA